ncbi:MAG: DNA helicase RecQ [Oscillospiraceae bacterium]|nr:DNA helicase RecQ [Oscillospiraceae bacterium]
MRKKTKGGSAVDKLETLKKYFGHQAFRPGQESLIDGVLSGRDVLGVMPTGGGKSLCYQIPALLLPGLTLVISPLISLMKDQVMALRQAGVSADFLNSSQSEEEMRSVYRRAWAGEYKLLYVAPERLAAEGFLNLCRETRISLVAVDEAHCVSQWGQDFRPSYLRIPEFLAQLASRPPVAALTATATGEVRQDMTRLLGLRDPLTLVTGFDRPNLYFDVLRPKKKDPALLALVGERREKSGIIYCSTRNAVEKVCALLQSRGFPATRYHAGLEEAERKQNQEDFRFDRRPIMVATNAFGMGIDKSNVSYVIHYNMPKSLEAYYQEAGRAGRDGEGADCILLYSGADLVTARFLIENGRDNEELSDAEREEAIRRDYERLEAMRLYCAAEGCYRGSLLDYFGQEHSETCGNCGNCRGDFVTQDVTRQAQMVLSCVKRAQDLLGYHVGSSLIAQTLKGSRSQKVREKGLDRLSTYGLMKGETAQEIGGCIQLLVDKGYLLRDSEYGGLLLAGKAGEVLFRGERVERSVRLAPQPEPLPREERPRREKLPAQGEEDLFQALKKLRYRLAQKENVPPFMIFSNATLTDMAAKQPRSLAELLEVSGVGEKKAEKYGAAFLLAIGEYLGECD